MADRVPDPASPIVGLPNVGKSTLLNRVLDRHLAAVSPRPQTTRNRILGIHRTTVDGLEPAGVDLCFVDTPGIQQSKGAVLRFMRDQALGGAGDCDVGLYVADASDPRGRGADRLSQPDAVELTAAMAGVPVVVALNKVDRVAKPALLPLIDGRLTPSMIGSDLAFTVHALPRVHLHVEMSQQNQEFPAEAWVLFSNNANEFLTERGIEALGELFKERLLSLLRIY